MQVLIAVPIIAAVAGFLYLILRRRKDALARSRRKICPFCAESIRETSTICRYCGKDIPDAIG